MPITHSSTKLRQLSDAKEKLAKSKCGAEYHDLIRQVKELRDEADELDKLTKERK